VQRRLAAARPGGSVIVEALAVSAVLVGALAFAGWCISVFVRTEIQAGADLTSKLIWNVGRGCCWAGAVILAGGLFGAVVAGVVRVLGGR